MSCSSAPPQEGGQEARRIGEGIKPLPEHEWGDHPDFGTEAKPLTEEAFQLIDTTLKKMGRERNKD